MKKILYLYEILFLLLYGICGFGLLGNIHDDVAKILPYLSSISFVLICLYLYPILKKNDDEKNGIFIIMFIVLTHMMSTMS